VNLAKKIKGYIGEELHSLIISNFSTTTPTTKAVSEIVLMDSVQNYFEFALSTCCGIPSITLEGTLEDWKNIRARLNDLRFFDLDWWIDHLAPVLDQFVEAYQGSVDKSFWSNIFKEYNGSGGPFISGWILTFFPYLKSGYQNDYVDWKKLQKRKHGGGLNPDNFGGGLNKAPFKWKYFNEVFEMNLLGGFIGVSQDTDTKALKPEIGWLVGERENEVSK